MSAPNDVNRRCTFPEKLRMDAYYFGFSETGWRPVDEVLSAVAQAGKGYHHTEDWNDAGPGQWSYAEEIQAAANRAAESALKALGIERARIRQELRQVLQDASEVMLGTDLDVENEPSVAVRLSEALDALNRICPEESAPAQVSPWQSIETAPAGVPLIVGWLDGDDDEQPERHDFDMIDDGEWRCWADRVEHAELCAPPGSVMPSERPPYSFWIAVPPLPRGDVPSPASSTHTIPGKACWRTEETHDEQAVRAMRAHGLREARLAALEAIAGTLLPLFQERFTVWEENAHGEAPTWMPSTLKLAAEFPTAALRALVEKEGDSHG